MHLPFASLINTLEYSRGRDGISSLYSNLKVCSVLSYFSRSQSSHSSYLAPEASSVMGEAKLLSVEEISKHNTPEDCWIVVDGNVWDMTEFAPEHPGAPQSKRT
jgi:cytochrome b involved in lipid metabolism